MTTGAASLPVREYLAECLWPGVTPDALAELGQRACASAGVRRDRRQRVRYLGSILMPADEVVFFVFSGPSASAVRSVAARAGIPFERIVASERTPSCNERKEP